MTAATVSFEGPFAELSPEVRWHSLKSTLRARPDADSLWLFGYGSLIWDELAPAAERRRALLDGWHRSLCVWSALARGSPARPGICLGLDRGGACQGLALRIDGPDLEASLTPVWERELWTDVYRPEWVDLASDDGPVRAVAFVVDRTSAQYVRGLSDDQIARQIAVARGEKGRCRDYLARVVAGLATLGIAEPGLAAMLARVDALDPNAR